MIVIHIKRWTRALRWCAIGLALAGGMVWAAGSAKNVFVSTPSEVVAEGEPATAPTSGEMVAESDPGAVSSPGDASLSVNSDSSEEKSGPGEGKVDGGSAAYDNVRAKESENKVRTTKLVARSGRDKVRKTMEVEATAYSHTGYRTATGTYPKVGTVAVDPRVIPLGCCLYVEGYGYGRAEDTGRLIKGNRIDVFFDTEAEALKWGRRRTRVYLLE